MKHMKVQHNKDETNRLYSDIIKLEWNWTFLVRTGSSWLATAIGIRMLATEQNSQQARCPCDCFSQLLQSQHFALLLTMLYFCSGTESLPCWNPSRIFNPWPEGFPHLSEAPCAHYLTMLLFSFLGFQLPERVACWMFSALWNRTLQWCTEIQLKSWRFQFHSYALPEEFSCYSQKATPLAKCRNRSISALFLLLTEAVQFPFAGSSFSQPPQMRENLQPSLPLTF